MHGSAKILTLALLDLLCSTVGLSSQTASSSSRGSVDDTVIRITNAWAEPFDKPIRRGNVLIEVEGSPVFLRSIKCVDGSTAHPYFTRPRYDGLSGLITNDLQINPPFLHLGPAATFDAAGHTGSIDDGHLLFTGGRKLDRKSRSPLLCYFEFLEHSPMKVIFGSTDDLESILKF